MYRTHYDIPGRFQVHRKMVTGRWTVHMDSHNKDIATARLSQLRHQVPGMKWRLVQVIYRVLDEDR